MSNQENTTKVLAFTLLPMWSKMIKAGRSSLICPVQDKKISTSN